MSSADPRRQGGFTLVEVLVALVMAGVLATVIFQVVRGQARFASVQSAQQEVQQNARGALEVLASDLRGIQPQGLVNTSANSITFLLPRVWGVSCGDSTGTTLPVLFPGVSDGSVMFAIDASSGLLADTAATAATTESWGPIPTPLLASYARVTSIPDQAVAVGNAASPCYGIRDGAVAAGLVKAVTVTGNNIPRVRAGKLVYLYQIVRYDVNTMSGASSQEYWIRRSNGLPADANQQPLAGPLPSTSGLAFTFYKADGTQFTPGSTRTELDQVARIAIKVVTRSRVQGRANLQDSVSTSVLLRNKS